MKKTLLIIAFLLGSGVIGFFIGKGLVILMREGNGGSVDNMKLLYGVAVALVSLVVAFVLNLILHEAGHMVFGLLTGYKFLSFRIFTYTLVKEESGWKWKKFSISGTAGQCLMIPPKVDRVEDVPYFWYNVGGVLVNFIIVVVCGLLLALFDLPPIPFSLCTMFVLTGVLCLLENAIPMTPAGVPNDGMNILTLWKHPEQRGSFARMMHIVAGQSFGKRLKELPEDLFVNQPLTANPSVMEISDRNIYQCWLYDNLRFDESREVAEEIMNVGKKLPALFRIEVMSDLLFLELATLNRLEVVKDLWDKKQEKYVRQAAKYMPIKHASLFAYELICNQNLEEAQKHYDEVLARKDKYSQPGEALTALAVMDALREKFSK